MRETVESGSCYKVWWCGRSWGSTMLDVDVNNDQVYKQCHWCEEILCYSRETPRDSLLWSRFLPSSYSTLADLTDSDMKFEEWVAHISVKAKVGPWPFRSFRCQLMSWCDAVNSVDIAMWRSMVLCLVLVFVWLCCQPLPMVFSDPPVQRLLSVKWSD